MIGIKYAQRACVGLLCGLLVACGGGGGGQSGPQSPPQPPSQPQTIVFNTGGPVSAAVGATVTNLASGGAGTGAISYASSNTAVATVDAANGVASLLTVGSTTITATKAASTGFASATATYTLNVSQGQQTIAFASQGPINALLNAAGSNIASGGGGTGAITYASSNTSAVIVNAASGATTAVGVGSATITATKAADANFLASQANYTINVQTAGKINAWIGQDDAIVHLPQSANGKMFGSALVDDCDLGETVAQCSDANLAAVSGVSITDPKATLATQAYYALVSNDTVGTPIVARASRFSERIGHAVVRFNNKYWVIGGATPLYPRVPPAGIQYARYADVWSSEDAVTWKLETTTAAFGQRWLQRAVVYNGAIWLIGGHAPAAPNQGVNDVYRSSDGVNWTLVGNSFALMPQPPYDPADLTATVFNGEIWIVRNGIVHSTLDGITWTPRGTGLFGAVSRAGATLAVYGNSMWYIGGVPGFVSNGNNTGRSATNQVWSSTNGTSWTSQPSPPFSPRFRHSAFIRNGKLWVFGGQGYQNGAVGPLPTDAWSTTNGTTWTQEAQVRLSKGFFLETIQETSPERVTIIGGIQGTYSNQVWQSTGTVQWEDRSHHAQFSARHTEGITYNGYLWAIGGGTTNEGDIGSGDVSDVWRSADGLNWTRIPANGSVFSPREGHRLAVFNNRLWLVGGWVNPTSGTGLRNNEVWSTTDGATWTQHTVPNFDARVGHALVSYSGRLWVIGGSTASGFVNDVWSSADGESWRRETLAAAFSPRSALEVVVFNNAMWVIGGGSSPTGVGNADAWRSTDGITWTQQATPAFQPRTWHAAAVANNRLFVIGGFSSEDFETATRYNDVWSTADGLLWTQESGIPFTGRGLHGLVVRNNELWMYGGLGIGYLNEVWRSPDGRNWRVGFTHDIVAP